jgi:tRNA pseudouridine38-40 synthase
VSGYVAAWRKISAKQTNPTVQARDKCHYFVHMRYFLDLAYDGSPYHGWQVQPNAPSVQEEVNLALSILLKQKTECVGSGRTDTGVHAFQQFAHFDAPKRIDMGHFMYQLNGILPNSIAVHDIRPVRENAHARFDAVDRSYRYFIHTRKEPFALGKSYFFSDGLDLQKIEGALKLIRQWNDFEAFSRVKTDVSNFDCTIFEAWWKEENYGHVFYVRANRFLRGMVRAMVGTLLDVGTGKTSLDEFGLILAKRDRKIAGRSVPPEGLFLNTVTYPQSVFI